MKLIRHFLYQALEGNSIAEIVDALQERIKSASESEKQFQQLETQISKKHEEPISSLIKIGEDCSSILAAANEFKKENLSRIELGKITDKDITLLKGINERVKKSDADLQKLFFEGNKIDKKNNDSEKITELHKVLRNWTGTLRNIESVTKALEIRVKTGEESFEKKQKSEAKTESDILSVKTKSGLLTLNRSTGSVKLNNAENDLNPQSREFKILLKLMAGKDYQATYQEILGITPSKENKRNLTFTIRNVKESLGILPKKEAKNKDCIKNSKGYGYRLIT